MIMTPSAPICSASRLGAHHLVGPFRARADQHRHAAGRLLDHDLDDLAALVGRHAQELAGAAERDQAVDAFLDLEIDQASERRFVDLAAVGGEGRDQDGVGAAKLLHVIPLLPIVNLLPCA